MMATTQEIQERLEKIDLQILKLLEERQGLCTDCGEVGIGSDTEAELLSLWVEEAAERGMDEAIVDKIARLVLKMCRQVEE